MGLESLISIHPMFLLNVYISLNAIYDTLISIHPMFLLNFQAVLHR